MTDDSGLFDPMPSDLDPYTATSGTEAVAPLLYAIVRMLRATSIVEYGPGHSTIFLLKALADNEKRERIEHDALVRKSRHTEVLRLAPDEVEGVPRPWSDEARAAYRAWLYSDGPACGANPSFYCARRRPRLHSFETLPNDHPYSQKVWKAIAALRLEAYFEPHYGEEFGTSHLPSQALPIDLAWNDCDNYRRFFTEYWEQLTPNSGMMVFHNVTAWTPLFDDICWMSEQRRLHNDLELLVLEEPHKLNQNSCAILRRRTSRPHFGAERPHGVLNALREFLGTSDGACRLGTVWPLSEADQETR